jgi:glycosyltransferase involved in cell wall biosynthesis
MRTVPLGVNANDFIAPAAPVAPVAPDSSAPGFKIGYFARIAPEKGLHNLVEAYRILRQERGLPPSRLRAAGYMAAAQRPYLQELENKLSSWGLRDEFEYLGTVDRDAKIRFLHDLDVFSVPTDYHEPKGLFLLEAMACGAPVVQPNHGAFPEMIEKTGGGVLSRSEQPADVADAIWSLWQDRARAATLGERGAAGVRAHYTVDLMADRIIDVYTRATDASPLPASATGQSTHQNVSVASR